MTTHLVNVQKNGYVLMIGINRPEKKNAFNFEIVEGLAQAYTQLSEDTQLRCGLVYSQCDDFTVGLDLPSILPRMTNGNTNDFIPAHLCDPWRNFSKACLKPIVTAVNGYCFTAGLELVLASEICIAAENTLFNQMEVGRGIIPLGGATYRLPASIGWHNAMRYMLTGDRFTAQQAKEWGLVQEITPVGQQLSIALKIAQKISNQAPLAVQKTLAHARLALEQGISVAQKQIPEIIQALAMTQDAQEGVLSMMQKRVPNFQGR